MFPHCFCACGLMHLISIHISSVQVPRELESSSLKTYVKESASFAPATLVNLRHTSVLRKVRHTQPT